MNRSERAKVAQETLDIFRRGYYEHNGKQVPCRSIFTTEFLSEDYIKGISLPQSDFDPRYTFAHTSVVTEVIEYSGAHCGVLNFASAKNPGGGFLNGSLAQEEALATSSDLFLSQLQAREMYDINKNFRSALYTHNMIYSRGVTFIRTSGMKLLPYTMNANVLTSPAVNAGAYYKNERGDIVTVLATMEERMRYIFHVFAEKGDTTIILGAYGCGVFENDANDVADIFFRLLLDEGLERYFREIVFAIFDPKGCQIDAFMRYCKRVKRATLVGRSPNIEGDYDNI